MSDIHNKKKQAVESESMLPDFSNPEEIRKAFIASEVFNRKY